MGNYYYNSQSQFANPAGVTTHARNLPNPANCLNFLSRSARMARPCVRPLYKSTSVSTALCLSPSPLYKAACSRLTAATGNGSPQSPKRKHHEPRDGSHLLGNGQTASNGKGAGHQPALAEHLVIRVLVASSRTCRIWSPLTMTPWPVET